MGFTYEKAASLTEALRLKARCGERGVFVAGGTDLLVDIRNDMLSVEPQVIIDISELEEIDYIKLENGNIRIGAGTKIADIQKSPLLERSALVLVKACREFANPLIKNRATLGGNLINASPAADMAPPLLVLGAKVVLKSVKQERELPLEDFLIAVKQTAQDSDELLIEIIFKATPNRRFEFLKLGQRNGTSIAIASLAIGFDVAEGIIRAPIIAVGSVAPTPLRAYNTEAVLAGVEPSPGNIRNAGEALKKGINPITDIRGADEYRREMVACLLMMAFNNPGYIQGVAGGTE